MAFENINMDEITEGRRRAIAQSIRIISFKDLTALGERLFPFYDHPWRTVFFDFINENAETTFYHATTDDHVQIIYCPAKEKGMWFLPEVGKGPLQAKGLGILKEIIEKEGRATKGQR